MKQLSLQELLCFVLMSLLWKGHAWKPLFKSWVTVVAVSALDDDEDDDDVGMGTGKPEK